jgi:hypothetical protein
MVKPTSHVTMNMRGNPMSRTRRAVPYGFRYTWNGEEGVREPGTNDPSGVLVWGPDADHHVLLNSKDVTALPITELKTGPHGYIEFFLIGEDREFITDSAGNVILRGVLRGRVDYAYNLPDKE